MIDTPQTAAPLSAEELATLKAQSTSTTASIVVAREDWHRLIATVEAATRARSGLDAGLREALRKYHDRACACPFDGSDPDCNVQGGVWVGTLLASSGEAAPVDGLDDLADGVRYAGGNGTSDYWRGFNDGIDKLVAAAREEADDGR